MTSFYSIVYSLSSHPADCTKFYLCSRGRAYLFDCPNEEHWSVKLNRCDYPHVAKCKPNGMYQFKAKKAKPFKASAQEEDSDQPEVGEFEIDPRCEGSDPFKPLQLRHATDCTKFYKCYMGKAYVIKCPKGQQWAQSLNRCEHPQIARCSVVRPAIKPAQAIEELDEDEDDDDDDDDGPTILDDFDYMIEDSRCAPDEPDMYHPIHFAHPTDCTMFYRCYLHKAFKAQCPGGLHFNEEKEYCDYPHWANCKAEANVFEANIMQASAKNPDIPKCPLGNQQVNFAIEDQKNRYFSCVHGFAYFMQCENEELFNPLSKKCEKFTRPQQSRQQSSLLYQYPAAMNQYQLYPEMMNQWSYPQYPGMMSPWSGLDPNFLGTMDQYLAVMNQYYGMMSQLPGYNQYPGMLQPFQMSPRTPNVPAFQVPNGDATINRPQPPQNPNAVVPQIPINRPQQPPQQVPQQLPQQIQNGPQFPSWMPVPNQNVPMPNFPNLLEKPSQDNQSKFNYENGRMNSRCPSADDPSKPSHLSHESECSKFYKCYNGRAFLLDCPSMQEWSEELQRCDYHQFAKCDPVELIKKRIQN